LLYGVGGCWKGTGTRRDDLRTEVPEVWHGATMSDGLGENRDEASR